METTPHVNSAAPLSVMWVNQTVPAPDYRVRIYMDSTYLANHCPLLTSSANDEVHPGDPIDNE